MALDGARETASSALPRERATAYDRSMLTVERATDADIEALAALVNSCYRGEDSRSGWTTEADFLDGQRTDAAMLRAELAERPGALMLVMRDAPAPEPIGTVWLEPRAGGTWYLGMLSVRPDMQARQLGRRLLAEGERYARERGATRMRISVFPMRDTLTAWYERRGFRATGEELPFPYGDERHGIPRRDDLRFVVLEKPLDPDGDETG
jgi:ribosomal protein S18 acetylase RimI-like enzyme